MWFATGVVHGQTGRNPKVRVADNSPTDPDFAVVSAMAIYRQLTQPLMQNSVVKLVPAGATIAELEGNGLRRERQEGSRTRGYESERRSTHLSGMDHRPAFRQVA